MKSQRVAFCLGVLNAVLLVGLITSRVPSVAAGAAASDNQLPVLRGRALEIVDDQGKVRASIFVHGPETVKGKQYPGAVVLRMGDPGSDAGPGVKLAASTNGAGLGLSGGKQLADGKSAGIELHADAPVVILRDKQGHEQIVKP